MSLQGLIFDIKKYSIHDGPGIRTTVFFKGCPLRCAWCHNPEGQSSHAALMVRANRCILCGECQAACPQGAIHMDGTAVTERKECLACGECVQVCYSGARERIGRQMTVRQVMADALRDLPFYEQSGGGVTFSGGEPLSQPDFLLELLRACREQEVHTALDTCGYAPWSAFESILEHTDLFLYDLKLMDERRHKQVTGVSNQRILRNLTHLSEQGARLRVRIPLIPGVNDGEENLRSTAQFLASLPQLEGIELLPYHDIAQGKYEALGLPYLFHDLNPISPAQVQRWAEVLGSTGLPIFPGGSNGDDRTCA